MHLREMGGLIQPQLSQPAEQPLADGLPVVYRDAEGLGQGADLARCLALRFPAAGEAGPAAMGSLLEVGRAGSGAGTWYFLAPAAGARLWAEERRQGTLELLLTWPVTVWQAALGKFLAAWAFTGTSIETAATPVIAKSLKSIRSSVWLG